MKTRIQVRLTSFVFGLLTVALCRPALAQGTAFTYQGRLTDGPNPVTGSYDFRFGLFSGAGGGLETGALTNLAVAVSNGLFVTLLDYGSNQFSGGPRFLEISVRSNGVGAFGLLTPRQQLTPIPYAIRAANFSGTVTPSQLPAGFVTNGAANLVLSGTFTGTHSGNGGGLTNLSLTTLGGKTAADFWQLDGNAVAPGQILGSTNKQTLEFIVNGFTAFRLQPNSNALPSVIGGNGNGIETETFAAVVGGGFGNQIDAKADLATIAGGQINTIESDSFASLIGGGANNRIQTNASTATIVGGQSHLIGANSSYTFIGGGFQNRLQSGTTFATIAGGSENSILTGGTYGFIGGGRRNTNNTTASVIAGGESNTIQPFADRAFIGGGLQNTVSGAAGMVLGGIQNAAAANAFAAGRRAKANHLGSFVWGDNNSADIASTANNQVTMRASGGYRLFSDASSTVGVQVVAGGNSWSALSDRNMKENFQPVDCRALLEKVVGVPVTTWNLKSQPEEIRHIGAMAQDFRAAFDVGEDDRHISTSDADGVTLAAIQGLNQKLTEELKRRDAENADLKQRLEALEKIVLAKNKIREGP